MNSVQANRLVKLANYLEELDNNKWDYSSTQRVSNVDIDERIDGDGNNKILKFDCKTAGCAIGCCITLFPGRFRSHLQTDIEHAIKNNDIQFLRKLPFFDINVIVKGNDGDWHNVGCGGAIEEFFGMSEQEADELFFGCNIDKYYGVRYLERVTKKMVVKKIYQLLDNYGYEVI